MDDFLPHRRARAYSTTDMIAALEAADLPPLPDDLRKIIVDDPPYYGPLVYALLAEFENPGGRSPVEDLPEEARAIADRLRNNLPLMNACILEQFRQTLIAKQQADEAMRQVAVAERKLLPRHGLN
jgi:hypothetical protein